MTTLETTNGDIFDTALEIMTLGLVSPSEQHIVKDENDNELFRSSDRSEAVNYKAAYDANSNK